MNTNKILAILFAVFTLGSLNETFNILYSKEANIAEQRSLLVPMAFIITIVSLLTTLYFWNKSRKTN